MKLVTGSLAVVAIAYASGCVNTTHPAVHGGVLAALRPRAPLADGERLLDPPRADDAILGHILPEPYDPARPLDEQLAPNPCAGALVDVEMQPRDAEIEDAAPAWAAKAHVYYRFEVVRRVEKVKTKAYAPCCREASCGVGYVRGLSFGHGEIAIGRPTMPGGDADVALDDDGRPLELTLLDRRPTSGYFAVAIEGLCERCREEERGPAKDEAYEAERLEIREDRENPDVFKICRRSGCLSENEFVRRYRARTGSHELDDFDRDRWAEVRWIGAGCSTLLGSLFVPLGAVVVSTADQEATQQRRNETRVAGGVVAGLGLAMLGMGVAFVTTPRDGSSTEHYLSKIQTRRFVERYNRALRGIR